MSIALVTDTPADIPEELLDKHGITAVSSFVRFGEEEFRDGKTITTSEFYERLERDKDVFPTTSQASAGDFQAEYERLLASHDSIVSIHISSTVSGTYSSAVSGAALADPSGERIKLVDSKTVSMGTGWIVLRAQKVIEDGGSLADVHAAASDLVTRVWFGGTPESLEYLQRGGRLTGARALVSNILHIRPVIAMEDGAVEVVAKPRSHRKAVAKLRSVAEERAPLSGLAAMHTGGVAEDEARELLDDFSDLVTPDGETICGIMGTALGAHLGPGSIGVGMVW